MGTDDHFLLLRVGNRAKEMGSTKETEWCLNRADFLRIHSKRKGLMSGLDFCLPGEVCRQVSPSVLP